MSSKKYAAPLRLEIKTSRSLLIFLLILHLAALSLIYFLKFGVVLSILMMIFLIISAYVSINKFALQKSPSVIVNITWDSNNDWILEMRDGSKRVAKIKRDSYVHPLMTILLFEPIIEKTSQNLGWPLYLQRCLQQNSLVNFSVVLLKDNVDANDFRRLRVRLKVGKPIDIDSKAE